MQSLSSMVVVQGQELSYLRLGQLPKLVCNIPLQRLFDGGYKCWTWSRGNDDQWLFDKDQSAFWDVAASDQPSSFAGNVLDIIQWYALRGIGIVAGPIRFVCLRGKVRRGEKRRRREK